MIIWRFLIFHGFGIYFPVPVQEYVNGLGAIVPFGHKGNFLVAVAIQPSSNESRIQWD
jgi:hypothetical protein